MDGTTSYGQALMQKDDLCICTIFQSHSSNRGSIFLAFDGAPASDFDALELAPLGDQYEDITPSQGVIYARGTSAGDVLTIIKKYRA